MSSVRQKRNFKPEVFDLFAKGYEIKPDKNFAMVALYYSLKGEIFDYQKYATIYAIAQKIPQMTFNEIQHYCEATPEQLEALFYAKDNFPQINPFKVMDLASSSYVFKAETFDFDNYEKIVSLLKEGVSFYSIEKLFNGCYVEDGDSGKIIFDENIFNTIDKIAGEAIKRKDIFLSAQNKRFTDIDIKDFIYQLATPIKNALKIVDEPTLIAAMGYKMLKFEQFVEEAANLKEYLKNTNNTENFLEIFYPAKSKKAQELESKISELKGLFSDSPQNQLQDLKNQINTYTKQLRTLLDQGKMLSPQGKIEMIEIMRRFDRFALGELLKNIKQIKIEGIEIWNKKISDLLVLRLGPAYNTKVEEKLHLLKSPYLIDIFRSFGKMEFKAEFEKLLNLLSKDDFGRTLDTMPHNIVTQQEFKKYALDYKKYTNPKVFPSKTFYDGDNLVEIRQVNMRDVSKSLYLGNESSTCTAMGGTHPEYAVPYITNTFVGAIEVVVNGKPVGNTMIYPILVNKANNQGQELALLIDDLKINHPYNKSKYLKEVSLFAEDLAKNIGIKEGKVYISDSNILGYDKEYIGSNLDFRLIGKIGGSIFLNATLDEVVLGDHSAILVPVKKIK